MLTPVDVAGKGGAFLRDLAPVRKAEYLVAATIRKDGPIPIHELVETTGSFHSLHPRPEIEVVSVAQDDPGLYVLLKLRLVNSLNGSDRAYWHENRGWDLTVVSYDGTRTGIRFGIGMVEGELHWREGI